MSAPGPRTVLVALWRMSRPAQLALIALVYALGVAMAAGRGATVDSVRVGVGLAALLPVAASVHYANEYADVETDALTDRTPFSGGSGALVGTDLDPRLALRAAVATRAIGLAVLAFAVLSTGGPGASALLALPAPSTLPATAAALLVGILVVGWEYSVGPLRLAWRGLGEATNAALGGVALPLYGFAVVAGRVTTAAALATVPFALVVFVNLLETQWPDRRADAAVGKRTLATRWSAGRLQRVYVAGLLAAAGTGIALAGRVFPLPVAVGTLVPMVGLLPGAVRFTSREEPLFAVVTMVGIAVASTVGWAVVAGVPGGFA